MGDCFHSCRSPVQETFQLVIRREQPVDLASASKPDLSCMVTRCGRPLQSVTHFRHADTRTALVRSGIGMEVRAGAPKPDISSVDAFKRALLNAKSIGYLP